MKPEIFDGSIIKGTNQLYVTTERVVVVRNGAFIKLAGNEIFYRAEEMETLNLRKKFKCSGKDISIKGNFECKIAPSDSLTITFPEYEGVSFSKIGKSNVKYHVGQKIYAQGGVTSSSSSNLTGEYTEFTVSQIGSKGEIKNLEITAPGKYIKAPVNPVKVMNESGDTLEVDIIFDEASQLSLIERHVQSVDTDDDETILRLSYSLPPLVEEGEFTLSKQVIFLDKPYASESFENNKCQMTFDFSPINGIPLLPPASLDPHATFNEAIKLIEEKFLSMEKRISNLENRNY